MQLIVVVLLWYVTRKVEDDEDIETNHERLCRRSVYNYYHRKTNVPRTKNARFAVDLSWTVSEKAGSASYRTATAKLLSKMMLNIFFK